MGPDKVWSHPLFGVAVTVIFYVIALAANRKWGRLHPMVLASGGIMLVLWLLRIPYEEYQKGGDMITFFLGPATVALGVPLYKQATRIGKNMKAIIAGVITGSLCGLGSAALFVLATRGTHEILLTMLPKSVTTPITVEIVRQLGGYPELGAVFTVLTGLLGNLIGPEFLRMVGVRGTISLGTAIGTATHGVGTARVLKESELTGSVSGFAMGLSGIVTSLLVIPLYGWLN